MGGGSPLSGSGKPSSPSPLSARFWPGLPRVLLTVRNIHVALFRVAVNWQQHRGVLASGEGENGRSIFFPPLGSGPAVTALQFRTYRRLSGKTRPYSAIVTDF